MNTKQIETALIERFGFTKVRAREVVQTTLLAIQAGVLNDGLVRLDGIGTFRTKTRAARTITPGFGPKKGQTIEVPERVVVTFKPSSKLL